ncbi:MAG: hypothetical protein J6336_00880 [Kiritimatiellae bacterium]|nr:hypothetical protein [Kiritimatiellia bacterium]
MKHFTYTARDSKGEIVRGALETADRKSAVAALNEEGLTPISIVETVAKPKARPALPSVNPVLLKKVAGIAVLAAVLVGGIIWFSHRPKTPHPKPTVPEKVGKPAAKPKPTAEKPDDPAPEPEVKPAAPQNVTVPVKGNIATVTLSNGKNLRVPLPAPGKTSLLHAQGSVLEIDSEGNVRDVTPRKLFDTPFENQLIGMAIDGGTFIPAFLKGMRQEDVIELLKKPVVQDPQDTETDLAKKEAVVKMKELMLDYINNGGNYEDFIDEVAAYAKEEKGYKVEGMRNLVSLLKQGKVEEAKEYRTLFNQEMAEKGFGQLRLPSHIEEALK